MTPDNIDALAETLHAAFYSDHGEPPPWGDLSLIAKGRWRRAARAALRTIDGNWHWLPSHAERSQRVADLLTGRAT